MMMTNYTMWMQNNLISSIQCNLYASIWQVWVIEHYPLSLELPDSSFLGLFLSNSSPWGVEATASFQLIWRSVPISSMRFSGDNSPHCAGKKKLALSLSVDYVRILCHFTSLVPRPPPYFALQFAFSIIHGSERAAKNGEGLHLALQYWSASKVLIWLVELRLL